MGSPRDQTITIKNCYSSGNVSGTYAGGIVGRHHWNSTAAEGTNCYYSTGGTNIGSVGNMTTGQQQTMNATAVEKLTQIHIDILNTYIEEDPDEIGTTGWKTWVLDKNGNPSFAE